MDTNRDNLRNIETYQSLLAEYGNSHKSLNWGSRESQFKRFEILGAVGIAKEDTVLDVGCGIGDFYTWLKKNRRTTKYTGIDITPGMIAEAKKRFPNCHFFVKDIFEYCITPSLKHDIIVASGIFYLREINPFGYMQETIRAMYSIAGKRVAFNCLSDWAEKQEPREFYANPIETLNFCRTITPFVTLRHDYHEGDFTIYMGKQ